MDGPGPLPRAGCWIWDQASGETIGGVMMGRPEWGVRKTINKEAEDDGDNTCGDLLLGAGDGSTYFG